MGVSSVEIAEVEVEIELIGDNTIQFTVSGPQDLYLYLERTLSLKWKNQYPWVISSGCLPRNYILAQIDPEKFSNFRNTGGDWSHPDHYSPQEALRDEIIAVFEWVKPRSQQPKLH